VSDYCNAEIISAGKGKGCLPSIHSVHVLTETPAAELSRQTFLANNRTMIEQLHNPARYLIIVTHGFFPLFLGSRISGSDYYLLYRKISLSKETEQHRTKKV